MRVRRKLEPPRQVDVRRALEGSLPPGPAQSWTPAASLLRQCGKSYVVEGGPEFRVLAVNDLGDGNMLPSCRPKTSLFLVGLKNL